MNNPFNFLDKQRVENLILKMFAPIESLKYNIKFCFVKIKGTVTLATNVGRKLLS